MMSLKGAYRKVAPFAFLALALPALAAPRCPADRSDEQARVSYVFDGDTLRLDDGRKVRVIGIDTPEIAHEERPAEPLAEEARTAVNDWMRRDARVRLRFDATRTDRYGRVLAHVFLADGSSLAAELLARGLGVAMVVQPNVWNIECRDVAEHEARSEKSGLWARREFQPVAAESLASDSDGFRVVEGRVTRIFDDRGSVGLELDHLLVARVAKKDLPAFHGGLHALAGSKVRVRGEVHPGRRHATLWLNHPVQIESLPR